MQSKPKTTYREGKQVRKAFRPSDSEVKVWMEERDAGPDVPMIEVPVSSTSQDRDGDVFSEEGLEDMKAQLDTGDVPMYLDHGISPETAFPDYRTLEMVGGWKEGIIEEGQLYARGALRPEKPEAQELKEMLQNGIAPVGFSVGFMIEESGEESDVPGERFDATDLLEISGVGIPSNPDAVVSDSALATAKAVAETTAFDGEPETLARSIMKAQRSPFEEETNTMGDNGDSGGEGSAEKQDGNEMQAALDLAEAYLSEGGSGDDVVSDLIDWAQEQEELGDDELAALQDVADAVLEASEEESLDALSVEEFLDTTEEMMAEMEETDEDDEEEDDEEETASGGEAGIEKAVLSAFKSEEFRSLIREEVRNAIEEMDLLETDEVANALQERILDIEESATKDRPSPSGTITTFEGDGGSESGEESGSKEKETDNEGGSERDAPMKPSPAFDPNGGK